MTPHRAPRRSGRTALKAAASLFPLLVLCPAREVLAVDDGTQMASPFRIDYMGYFAQGDKVALYLSPRGGSVSWELLDASSRPLASGATKDYVAKDHASGDSFFRIDFSSFQGTPGPVRLKVNGETSEAFDIKAALPYQDLADRSFDYFKDHRTADYTFDQFLNHWGEGKITGGFWNDAGDKGFYTVNTALAAFLLMNLEERYPEADSAFKTGVTLYDEVLFGTDLMRKVILPGQKLAVAKLHTNVKPWGPCPPFDGGGSCVSKPETKATFAVARTLAQLARLHLAHGRKDEAAKDFASAKAALESARREPKVCLDFSDFGGEGGIYPDNDNYSIFRNPKKFRDPCHPDRNNIEDDEYSALVEVFLAAEALSDASRTALGKEVKTHPRFAEVDEFWWAAVATLGNLSLLTEKPAGIDLEPIRQNLFRYAELCIKNMEVGYPGVTKDQTSHRWDSGDQDQVDNNWRWGSNRLILDDGILLAVAAEEKLGKGDKAGAARYARRALRTMDYLLGTNAMALSMVTGFGKNAVERTYDCCVPNSHRGKMVLGPNSWTNADDPDMPPFGSLPGMKMMPTTGTGWAAREIDIDANAPLVWMAFWADHRAGALAAQSATAR